MTKKRTYKKKENKFNKREIVKKFTETSNQKQKGFWPREMKILNYLLEKYPDENFWIKTTCKFKLNSLAWFRSEDGDRYLEDKYFEFGLDFERKEAIVFDEDNSSYFKPLEMPHKKITTTKQIFKNDK